MAGLRGQGQEKVHRTERGGAEGRGQGFRRVSGRCPQLSWAHPWERVWVLILLGEFRGHPETPVCWMAGEGRDGQLWAALTSPHPSSPCQTLCFRVRKMIDVYKPDWCEIREDWSVYLFSPENRWAGPGLGEGGLGRERSGRERFLQSRWGHGGWCPVPQRALCPCVEGPGAGGVFGWGLSSRPALCWHQGGLPAGGGLCGTCRWSRVVERWRLDQVEGADRGKVWAEAWGIRQGVSAWRRAGRGIRASVWKASRARARRVPFTLRLRELPWVCGREAAAGGRPEQM